MTHLMVTEEVEMEAAGVIPPEILEEEAVDSVVLEGVEMLDSEIV